MMLLLRLCFLLGLSLCDPQAGVQLEEALGSNTSVTLSASHTSAPPPAPSLGLGDLASYKEQLLSGAAVPPAPPLAQPAAQEASMVGSVSGQAGSAGAGGAAPSSPGGASAGSAAAGPGAGGAGGSAASSSSGSGAGSAASTAGGGGGGSLLDDLLRAAGAATSAPAQASSEDSQVLVTEPEADTLQQRTNFAAQAAGAVIMSSAPEWKGIGSLLTNDLDTYALSKCDAKKWVILGLSEDVMVDAIVVSNEEKYSSSVHLLRVLGSQKYPATEWIVLGNFTAENRLGEQAFPLEVKTWVRYLKFTWLSHYGHEFYCTWTRIKVHGSTMLEELQSQIVSSDAEVLAARAQIEAHKGHNASALAAAATASSAAAAAASVVAAAAAAAPTTAAAAVAADPNATEGSAALAVPAASAEAGGEAPPPVGGADGMGSMPAPQPFPAARSSSASASPSAAVSTDAAAAASAAAGGLSSTSSGSSSSSSASASAALPSSAPGSATAPAAQTASSSPPSPSSPAPHAGEGGQPSRPPPPASEPGHAAAAADPGGSSSAWEDPESALLLEVLQATRELEYLNVTAENLDTREERNAEVEALQCLATAWADVGLTGNGSSSCSSTSSSSSSGSSSGSNSSGAGSRGSDGMGALVGGDLHTLFLSASPAPEAGPPSGAAALNPSSAAALPPSTVDLLGFGALGTIQSRRDGAAFPSLASAFPAANTANVFKTLTRKLKDLEIDSSVTQSYLSDMHTLYSSALSSLTAELGALKAELKNATALWIQAAAAPPPTSALACPPGPDACAAASSNATLFCSSGSGEEAVALAADHALSTSHPLPAPLSVPQGRLLADGAAAAANATQSAQGNACPDSPPLLDAALLDTFSSDMKSVAASVGRMESRQLALALAVVRILSEGGVAASLSAITGDVIRHDDASLMQRPDLLSQARAQGKGASASGAAGDDDDDVAATLASLVSDPPRTDPALPSDALAWHLLKAARAAIAATGLGTPLRSIKRSIIGSLSPLVTVVLVPPAALNVSEGSSGSSSSSSTSCSAPSTALQASLEATQLQVASLQGSLHLALILAAFSSAICLLLCCGAMGACCCVCLCRQRHLQVQLQANLNTPPLPSPAPLPLEPNPPPGSTALGSVQGPKGGGEPRAP